MQTNSSLSLIPQTFALHSAEILTNDASAELTNVAEALLTLSSLLDGKGQQVAPLSEGERQGLAHIVRLLTASLHEKVFDGILPLTSGNVREIIAEEKREASHE